MNLLLKNISLPLAHFTLELDVELNGRVTAIFGPSGAGKTSLLDLIAGLRKATTAFISFDGHTLTDREKNFSLPPRRRGIGYVPQDLALFPHLSVRQNVLYGFKPGAPNDSRLSFDRVVEILEIQPIISRRIGELSGGEKQRVALARALLSSPRLLLLDEPLASLDAPLKARIIPYFIRVRDEFKIPILYVTHDRQEAQALADEMLVLDAGRALQRGPILEVLNQPASAAVATLTNGQAFQAGN